MKAMILAAGLGTRLKPWTLSHPKALVPVGGVPMLERVIWKLRGQGFSDIVVNVHHFSNQIVDFLNQNEIGRGVRISDESGLLLDTGGGILYAEHLLCKDNREPFMVHNVDILSNADLGGLMRAHEERSASATLMVSGRDSSRKLIFDSDMTLRGWHSLADNRYRPEGYEEDKTHQEYAFSGIHIMSTDVFDEMRRLGYEGKFPIMDFYLNPNNSLDCKGWVAENLQLLDIGKPETLSRANQLSDI